MFSITFSSINCAVKAVQLTTYFSQGSAATDLRGGGSFNSNFLHRSFMNFNFKFFL